MAVTGGVLLALPQYHLLLMFITFIVIAFLCIEQDAWTTMAAPVGAPFSGRLLCCFSACGWSRCTLEGTPVQSRILH